jgi:hypothetical protein
MMVLVKSTTQRIMSHKMDVKHSLVPAAERAVRRKFFDRCLLGRPGVSPRPVIVREHLEDALACRRVGCNRCFVQDQPNNGKTRLPLVQQYTTRN